MRVASTHTCPLSRRRPFSVVFDRGSGVCDTVRTVMAVADPR